MSNHHRKVKRSTMRHAAAAYLQIWGCAACGTTTNDSPLHFYWKDQEIGDTRTAAVFSSWCLPTIVQKTLACDVFCHACRRARTLEHKFHAGARLTVKRGHLWARGAQPPSS